MTLHSTLWNSKGSIPVSYVVAQVIKTPKPQETPLNIMFLSKRNIFMRFRSIRRFCPISCTTRLLHRDRWSKIIFHFGGVPNISIIPDRSPTAAPKRGAPPGTANFVGIFLRTPSSVNSIQLGRNGWSPLPPPPSP